MSTDSSRRAVLTGVVGLVLGVVLALVVAGPDPAGLVTALPGYENDDGRNAVYLHHQVHAALLAGRLDLSDPYQFFPVGTPLLHMHGGNVLEMLVSGVARLLAPFPAWLSIGALAWIPLNLLAFLPLGLRLWERPVPALAGAVTWAVAPVALHQIAAGRLTQVALVGLPLAVLGLLDIAERGGRRAWLTAGLGMALTGIGYWFSAMFLCFVAPLFAVHGVRTRGLRATALDLVRAAGVCLVAVSPWVLALGWPRLTGQWTPKPRLDGRFLSPVFSDALQLAGPQPDGLVGWLPIAVGAGALASLALGRRRLLWVGAAALCIVFALGPAQDLGGTRWLLPSYPIWRLVPGLDRMVHPDRWLGVGALFLSVLAIDGLARRPGWQAWLSALVPAGVVAQLLSAGIAPLDRWTWDPPEIWHAVAARPETGAIAVVPIFESHETCAWQPLHDRPLLGGMGEFHAGNMPDAYRDYIGRSPLLVDLWALGKHHERPVRPFQADLDQLREDGFDTVVLDQAAWDAWPRRVRDPVQALTDALGPPIVQTADGAAWLLPETGRAGTPALRRPFGTEGPAGPDPKAGQ